MTSNIKTTSRTTGRAWLVAACAAAIAGAIVAPGCRRADPAALNNEGLARLQQGDFEGALTQFRRLVRISPENPTAHANLGKAYWQAGKPESAVKPLQRAAELAPGDARFPELLGQVYMDLGQWAAAAGAFSTAATIDPNARVLTQWARARIRAGEFDAGRTLLDRALATHTNFGPALFTKAVLLRDTYRDADGAAACFDRYARVGDDPQQVDEARRFVSALAAQRHRDRTRTNDTARVTHPVAPPRGGPPPARAETVSELLARARSELSRGQSAEAMRLVTQARQREPRNADAAWEQIQIYDRHLKQHDKADAAMDAFVRQFPNDPRAQNAVRTRDIEKGVPITRTASTVRAGERPRTEAAARPTPVPGPTTTTTVPPDDDAAKRRRAAVDLCAQGLTFHQAGNFDRAVDLYLRARAMDAKNLAAAYNLGVAYDAKGETEEARDAFTAALGIQPAMVEARYMLAYSLRKLGQTDEAIAELKTLLRIKPDYARAHWLLALLYERSRQPAAARQHLQRYLQIEPAGPNAERARKWLDEGR